MSIFKFGFRVGGSQETRLASRILVMIVMYSCGDRKEGPDMHIGLYSILPHSLLLLSHSLSGSRSLARQVHANMHVRLLHTPGAYIHVSCMYVHESAGRRKVHIFQSMHLHLCIPLHVRSRLHMYLYKSACRASCEILACYLASQPACVHADMRTELLGSGMHLHL